MRKFLSTQQGFTFQFNANLDKNYLLDFPRAEILDFPFEEAREFPPRRLLARDTLFVDLPFP